MSTKSLIFHAHCYQPPREDAWTGVVPEQPSAAPFHDWNDRITHECYRPLAELGLFEKLSFNIGPTLASYLQKNHKDVYASILAADKKTNNAIAQGYNHSILPLCNDRDRRLQIHWALVDFEKRFGRKSLGFWCPECAVNTDTLQDLYEEGVRFTVLSPFQADKVKNTSGAWVNVGGAQFDPTIPYYADLGSGRCMDIFFYDATIAQKFAFKSFKGIVDLMQNINSCFNKNRGHDELLTIAIDGETIGHHKKSLPEDLKYALLGLECMGVDVINFQQARARAGANASQEVVLYENSSWSCCHGIERWKSNCGCGAERGEKQHWRAPLRNTMDWLRDAMGSLYEQATCKILGSPWKALENSLAKDYPEGTVQQAFEMMFNMHKAYTSCAWFFSSIRGIEPQQNIQYALKAIAIAKELTGVDLGPEFQCRISKI